MGNKLKLIYDEDPDLIEVCLNCKKPRCIGNCDDLKLLKEKKYRENEKKRVKKK